MTTVRLAIVGAQHALVKGLREPVAPAIRLAVAPGGLTHERMASSQGYNPRPAILVSYAYWHIFSKRRKDFSYRSWALDSGAFTVFNQGKQVELESYIELCQAELSGDDPPEDVFALDVIGSHEGSARNTEKMWNAGIQAIPCFHIGEPWSVLRDMANSYPKIALGGVAVGVSKQEKQRWLEECFAQFWVDNKVKVHGFGMHDMALLMRFPFHSVDASNWELQPCAFGRWAAYGGADLRIRGGHQNLQIEVEHHLRKERKVQQRWARQFRKLGWV